MAADSLNQLILEKVNEHGSVDTLKLSAEINKDHQLLVGAVKSLQTLGDVSMSKKWPFLTGLNLGPAQNGDLSSLFCGSSLDLFTYLTCAGGRGQVGG